MYMPKSVIQIACKKGYTLPSKSKDQLITCNEDGESNPQNIITFYSMLNRFKKIHIIPATWTPHPLSCHKVFCSSPANQTNAEMITQNRVYTYGTIAVYRCLPGYMIMPGRVMSSIVCQDNSLWSDNQHLCLPACPAGFTAFNRSEYNLVL